MRGPLWSDLEQGRWGLIALEPVLLVLLSVGVISLAVHSLASADELWHEAQARRDREAGIAGPGSPGRDRKAGIGR